MWTYGGAGGGGGGESSFGAIVDVGSRIGLSSGRMLARGRFRWGNARIGGGGGVGVAMGRNLRAVDGCTRHVEEKGEKEGKRCGASEGISSVGG